MNERLRGIGMTSQRTRDRLVQRLREQGIADPRVLSVMAAVPRHIFVDEALSSRAYEDTALPIGHGQTISQPYVVARMSEALVTGRAPGRVLEIGTGSGYQSAVLAHLAEQVYSVERIGTLLQSARRRFRDLGLSNIRTRHDDGRLGWPSQAPYDGILVAAAHREVPPALLAQLAEGGRLVMPVGGGEAQRLHVMVRQAGRLEASVLEAVSFVPLLDGAG